MYPEFACAYTVQLARKNLRRAGAECLAEAVQRAGAAAGTALRLTTLDLSENRLGDAGVAALAPVLARHACALSELDLGWNSVGARGAGALVAEVLTGGSALRRLDLSCNDLGDAGASVLSTALACRGQALRVLRLDGNRIGAAGARALAIAIVADACNLRELELGRNQVGPAGAEALAAALAGCQRSIGLELLGLQVNRLRDAGATALASALAGCPAALSGTLDLAGNHLSDTAAHALADTLCCAPSLVSLDLSYNNLTNVGCEVLCEALEGGRCAGLAAVKLLGNPGVSDAFTTRLALACRRNVWSLVPFCPLRSALELLRGGGYEVDFAGLKIGPARAEEVAKTLESPVVRVLALGLSDNRLADKGAARVCDALGVSNRLTSLDLSWNRLKTATAVTALLSGSDTASAPPALTYLNLECNNLGDAGAQVLAEALTTRWRRTTTAVAGASAAVGGGEATEASARADGDSVLGVSVPVPRLELLNLAGNSIGLRGSTALARALEAGGDCLTELNLCRNQVGHGGAVELAAALRGGAQLRTLRLSVNRIGDRGASALAAALSAAPAAILAMLDLGGNMIGDAGALALEEALRGRALPTAELDLTYNRISGTSREALALVLEARAAADPAVTAGTRLLLTANPE
eukprot:NODE_2399_length_2219_cov_16.047323.p1 GENE.NODE_2399_length_2219_cov_16.047323~~NODE_2399_length_2219_cov_16.047323.p1  ORF type:complete len:643 (-),score=182.62 NODE_2399_length_2219_cov_16.047323:205-2133(-)